MRGRKDARQREGINLLDLAVFTRLRVGSNLGLDVGERVVVRVGNRLVGDALASGVFAVEAVELGADFVVVELGHRGRNGNVRTLLGVTLGENEIDLLDYRHIRRISSGPSCSPSEDRVLTGPSGSLDVEKVDNGDEKSVPDSEEEETSPGSRSKEGRCKLNDGEASCASRGVSEGPRTSRRKRKRKKEKKKKKNSLEQPVRHGRDRVTGGTGPERVDLRRVEPRELDTRRVSFFFFLFKSMQTDQVLTSSQVDPKKKRKRNRLCKQRSVWTIDRGAKERLTRRRHPWQLQQFQESSKRM